MEKDQRHLKHNLGSLVDVEKIRSLEEILASVVKIDQKEVTGKMVAEFLAAHDEAANSGQIVLTDEESVMLNKALHLPDINEGLEAALDFTRQYGLRVNNEGDNKPYSHITKAIVLSPLINFQVPTVIRVKGLPLIPWGGVLRDLVVKEDGKTMPNTTYLPPELLIDMDLLPGPRQFVQTLRAMWTKLTTSPLSYAEAEVEAILNEARFIDWSDAGKITNMTKRFLSAKLSIDDLEKAQNFDTDPQALEKAIWCLDQEAQELSYAYSLAASKNEPKIRARVRINETLGFYIDRPEGVEGDSAEVIIFMNMRSIAGMKQHLGVLKDQNNPPLDKKGYL